MADAASEAWTCRHVEPTSVSSVRAVGAVHVRTRPCIPWPRIVEAALVQSAQMIRIASASSVGSACVSAAASAACLAVSVARSPASSATMSRSAQAATSTWSAASRCCLCAACIRRLRCCALMLHTRCGVPAPSCRSQALDRVGGVRMGVAGHGVSLGCRKTTGIRDGPHEPFIADSVDFVVGQVETLSRDDLSSRLMLNVDVASIGSLMLPDSLITIMDTNDYSAVPQQLKEQLNERYPGARRAVLKTGGDFPFLSRPDEVNLYLQLHLRRVGVEPRSELVQGFTRDGSAGSSKDQRDGGDSFGNSGEDNGHHGSGGTDHDRHHCGSESHNSDEPIPTSTMLANTVLELVI
ncbi:uncharacterized protein LOC110437083 isoform X2 [Sorghum bicolor]|uniref:uncharacterized protein LOC110437083 isoform X2 n=1 Tax=Sorghum bicolor TaxID=4558 RepID=UPI000B425A36|nr:uncharacterized protein LOC110437083 isoform X2 [Sorghum bicolor]|eukprot:XP_021320937.1 uncharacterized protein LOC110437083 isoform X2 [Sorghum bicolor]